MPETHLNYEQVIREVYSVAANALRVSGGVGVSDGTNTATITDVAGKKSLDVNVTSLVLNASDDSVSVKSPTTGYSIEPTEDGSIKATELQGLIEVLNSLVFAFIRNQPQLDTANRTTVRLSAIDSNLTLSNLSNLNNLSGGNSSGIPYQLSSAFHIYDNIITS